MSPIIGGQQCDHSKRGTERARKRGGRERNRDTWIYIWREIFGKRDRKIEREREREREK